MSYEIKNKSNKVIATIDDGDISIWSETGDYLFIDLYCEGELFSHTIWDAYDRNLMNQYGAELGDSTIELLRGIIENKYKDGRKLWQE